jgi:putative ABC transport system permease protein
MKGRAQGRRDAGIGLVGLALRRIEGSPFRSWTVFLCMLVLAASTLFTTLMVRGAERSLRLGMDRLGADVVVVPEGTQDRVETALLSGKPTSAWMRADTLAKVEATPGVAAATAQLFLASLSHASCCSASEMLVVAFDPKTDFTIGPWLEKSLGKELGPGEAIGGSRVSVPADEEGIRLYGSFVSLVGNLEPTGTGLDETLFLTFETARNLARTSSTRADKPLEIPAGSVSAILVKVSSGSDPHEVAVRILRNVPGVTPIVSPDLFGGFRRELGGLLRGVLAVAGIAWVLAIVLVGLVFSMAVDERRREIGVLRALGATRAFVLLSLLCEAGMLALAGGTFGIALATLAVALFRDLIVTSLGMPFLFPSIAELLALFAGGLALALVGVTSAALLPALRISRRDPAAEMRE